VHAYLCEVVRTGQPHEVERRPTWFPAEKVKRRLREGRSAEDGFELERVVDKAVSRIRRLRSEAAPGDALQRVWLEISPPPGIHGCMQEASLVQYLRGEKRFTQGPVAEVLVNAHTRKVLQFAPAGRFGSNPMLLPGPPSHPQLREYKPSGHRPASSPKSGRGREKG
jgi:hypothetical protein